MSDGVARAPWPKTFVVNMARDVERRRYMEGRLAELGVEAEFITAVDGRALPAGTKEAVYSRRKALRIYGVEMLDSEIGCFLSHRSIYERMVRDGIGLALVLEDDVRIDGGFAEIVRDLAADGSGGWLVVRFDSKRGRVVAPKGRKFAGVRVRALPGGAGLYRLGTHVLGVGGYLITRAGAERMLAYGAPIFMPIDQTMDRFWENSIVPFVVRPFPVTQAEDFGSHSESARVGRREGAGLGVRLRRRLQRMQDGVRKRVFNLRRGSAPHPARRRAPPGPGIT